MLGFSPGLELHFDGPTAAASVLICIFLSTLGWFLALGKGSVRPLLGGVLVGVGLTVAHFLDMAAIRFEGEVRYDLDLVIASVMGGLALCALTGWLLMRDLTAAGIVGGAVTLTIAVLFLHFVAMASVNIESTNSAIENFGLLDLEGLGIAVVGASALIITSALGVACHSHRMAFVTSKERTYLVEALGKLRRSEEHHRAFVELSPEIPWVARSDGAVTELGPLWAVLVGAPLEQGLGQGWARFVHPDDLATVLKVWETALTSVGKRMADARYRLRLSDGNYRWFRARGRPRMDDVGRVVAWYGTLEDIHDQVTAELALRDSEERYRLASQASNDVIWDWVPSTGRVAWAGAVQQILGEDLREGTSLDWWSNRVHPEDRPRVTVSITEALGGHDNYWQAEYRFRHARGDYIMIFDHAVIVRDGNFHANRVVGSMLDITARKVVEEELHRAAYHDPLTKLLNRAAYMDKLNGELSRAEAEGSSVGLIFADLNNFKSLNDSFGHAAGDELLREVADRLVHGLPVGASVARLGGDEFAIILPGLVDQDARTEAVQAVLAGLKAPYSIENTWVDVSFCAGAALWPRDAESITDLLRCADLALYAAKAEMPGTVRWFRPEMLVKSEKRRRMLDTARSALQDDRIVPFYQPKVCLRTGQIAGFEALLRWHDHRHGLQPPSAVAAAFEDVELVVQITNRMLDAVIRDRVAWRAIGIPVGRIAVNVSSADFRRHDLADRILGRLEAVELPPSCLEVEVTESVFLGQNIAVVRRELQTLRDAGVTIALDDFGTGYASLTHLQQFPVSVLKIDMTFIADIETPRGAIVDALLHIAQSLQIVAVAEGVETNDQVNYLRAKGCDLCQGFLFSRPVPALRVPGLLATWSAEADGLLGVSVR